MKHYSFIITLLIALLSLTSCKDENVKKLRREVAAMDASCPVNMGISGNVESVKYEKKGKRVIFNYSVNEAIGEHIFLKKNKDRMLQQLKLSFSTSKTLQMIKDITNANASLMIVYKSPSGKTAKFELSCDELKDLISNPLSDSEIQRLTILNKIENENSKCPYEVEEGITQTKVAFVDNYMVFYYAVDENLHDMAYLKSIQNELKENMNDNLKKMANIWLYQKELNTLVDQNIGYHYRYYGNKSKDYYDIIFTPEELTKYITQ